MESSTDELVDLTKSKINQQDDDDDGERINNDLLTSQFTNLENSTTAIIEQTIETLESAVCSEERNVEDDYEILNKNTCADGGGGGDGDMDNGGEIIKSTISDIGSDNQEVVVNGDGGGGDVGDDGFMDILGNGSLIKKIFVKGETDKRPRNGQICTINYKIKLNEFDENYVESNECLQFILGDGDVLSAFEMVVSLMNLNEHCFVVCDARHGYGEKGNLPNVPPDSKLYIDLKLNEVCDAPDLTTLNPIERLSLAEAKKVRGNYYYNRQTYDQAVNSYKKGLKYFNETNLSGEESEDDLKKFNDIKIAILMNIALSNYKLQLYEDALESLNELLVHQPNHVKALFIKGKILAQINEHAESIKYFTRALELDDKNADIKKELTKAQAKYKLEYDREKVLYKKMIAGVSESNSKTNNKKSSKSLKNSSSKSNGSSSTLFNYLTGVGVLVAVASISIAAYAKYKNLF